MFKVNNKDTRTTLSKLTIKISDKDINKDSFIVNFDSVILVSLLLTYFTPCSSVSIVNFEQLNAHWLKARDDHRKYFHKIKFSLMPGHINSLIKESFKQKLL